MPASPNPSAPGTPGGGGRALPAEWTRRYRLRRWLANKIAPRGVFSFDSIQIVGRHVTMLRVAAGVLHVHTADAPRDA